MRRNLGLVIFALLVALTLAFPEQLFHTVVTKDDVSGQPKFKSVVESNHESLLMVSDTTFNDVSFTEPVSNVFARYAFAAYCVNTRGAENLARWDCPACVETPVVQNATGVKVVVMNAQTFAYVGYVPQYNVILVSFAGTDPINIVNWISDIDFLPTSYPYCEDCKVHRGFYKAYKAAHNDILATVRQFQKLHPDVPVTVTGHSLGAALSTHAAIALYHENVPLALPLYNFGGPRVGNTAFANHLRTITKNGMFRVVHYKDPVVQVPFHNWGFTHTSTEVFYNANESSFKICDRTNGEDKSCSYTDLPLIIPDAVYHISYGQFSFFKNYLKCKLK